MTTSEKMTMIATNPEAPAKEQPKRYIYTEKGARAARSHNAKAGDPYNRPVSKSTIKQYIKAGFIAEAQ